MEGHTPRQVFKGGLKDAKKAAKAAARKEDRQVT
jgi:hypothetical protein